MLQSIAVNNRIANKRVLVLMAAVLIQSCLGGLYAWSEFVPALIAQFGFTAGETQLVFGLAIALFTVTMVFAGRLLNRLGARKLALLGGLLFVVGHLITAASTGRFIWLLIGSGLFVGTSIGFGYVSVLTTVIQWFPLRKGLVTGMAVAGFGGGAIILSTLTASLLSRGCEVLDIIRGVGLGYGAVICLASICLFLAPHSQDEMSFWDGRSLLKDRVFRRLATGMFCGTFAGLLVIGSLKPIGLEAGLSPAIATVIIGIFAVGNVSGRLLWGYAADRFGYMTIPASLLFFSIALTVLLLFQSQASVFLVCVLLSGFGFGSCYVVYAAQVAARYGSSRVAHIYPLVFISQGIAGLSGPLLGGYLYDWTGSYTGALAAGAVVLLAGAWFTERRGVSDSVALTNVGGID